MSAELRGALREAAALPRAPLDLDRVMARGRRRRRRRIAAAAGSLVLFVAITSVVLTIPRATPDQPAPVASPVRFAELPPGWSGLPPPPEVRHYAATAWTGEQLLLWGGTVPAYSETPEGSGFGFDTRTGRWQEMAPSPLAPRTHPASAWTGRELLVWGGTDGDGHRRLDDGAAYDPRRDTWRRLPPAPVSPRAPLSVWTGRELVVWGTGVRTPTSPPTDGAAYDAAADTWRPIAEAPVELTDAVAAWTGREMIVFGARLDGNNSPATPTAIGAAYDPHSDTWRRLPDSDLSPQASTAAWNGEELIAADYLSGASAYDPARDGWRSLPDVPLRPGECYPGSAPAGADVVGHFCGGMAVYHAGDDRWRAVPLGQYAGWWAELIPAGPVVILLVQDVPGGAGAVLAYRPPG